MNLASLNFTPAANRGAVMTVTHPIDKTPLTDDDGNPVTMTLLGRDADVFVQRETAARQRALDAMTKDIKITVAEADAEGVKTLAALVTGWSGVVNGWVNGDEDNEPVEFSPEAAIKLFSNPGLRWLRNQADAFISDRGNFLKASQTT